MWRLFLTLTALGALVCRGADLPTQQDLGRVVSTSRTNLTEALVLCDRLVQAYPTNVVSLRLRAKVRDQLRQYAKGIEDLSEAIRWEPASPDLWQGRGELYFKAGRFKESVQDFDRVIELLPEQAPHHWQRGISLYYARRYTEGRQQFETHKTVNPNDVENAVWHFLCAARESSVTNARTIMVSSGPDARVPMKEVERLYRGTGSVEDVITSARKAPPASQAMFYAHLYLGIYFDVLGDRAKALEHLRHATGEFANNHYMGEVARVHLSLLEKH